MFLIIDIVLAAIFALIVFFAYFGNYLYFVADKNGKTYFNETDSAHVKTVNKLKSEGLWIEYQN